MKIVTVIGARPQFVKAAVVSRALSALEGIREVIIHTGQHFDANMSAVFFEELGIPKPDYSLDIHTLPHGAMTGRMIEGIESVLQSEQPDWLLIYGDTDSTLAGTLAAVKMQIPVAHVEAGLRSFNRQMPEEINRIATDVLASLLFAPTQAAVDNLTNEGIASDKIVRTGDVMYDCSVQYGELAKSQSQILTRLNLQNIPFVLCTAHRAENTDSPELLANLVNGLTQIARDLPVVMPVHPRTLGLASKQGLRLDDVPGLHAIDPIGYLDMLRLEQAASLIMTDSGGVQKEAYFLRVPCVTMRPQTEWIELIDAGWNVLCPLERGVDKLVSTVRLRLGSTGQDGQLYGDGRSAESIAAALAANTAP